MNAAQFPFLTIELLESGEIEVLKCLPAILPAAAPYVPILQKALPLVHSIPAEAILVQHVLDAINNLLGKASPAVAG